MFKFCSHFKDLYYFSDSTTKIYSLQNTDANTIRIYPNPAKAKFTVDLGKENTNKTLIEVFDITERRVYQKESAKEKLINIDLKVKPGIYVLSVTGKSRASYKIIVE